jgi:acyl-CoA reductase-like NAD-dependent aldehyde dehydrogenase
MHHRSIHRITPALCLNRNFPVDEILLLAIPALIAGNGVLIKPSEVAPLCGAEAAKALAEGLREHKGLVGLVQVRQGC